jgi:hypothetical protein
MLQVYSPPKKLIPAGHQQERMLGVQTRIHQIRKLLSRKVEVLPRKVVKKKGEGFDSKK